MARTATTRPNRLAPPLAVAPLLAMAVLLCLDTASAQTAGSTPTGESDASRIERLERMVSTVVEENRRLADEVRSLREQYETRPALSQQPSLPSPAVPDPELPGWRADLVDSDDDPEPPPATSFWTAPPPIPTDPQTFVAPRPRFHVEYNNGFEILPENIDETPFSLKIRSQNMFRYNGFARDATYWIDSSGQRQAIANSNYFGVPRGRLIFSGTALLPRLSYLLNIDYNSVTSNPIGFRAYELGYRFSRAFELYVGQTKVPGSREWLVSSFSALQGPDRSMATTFFRPSLSQGVWVIGQPFDELYYHAMVSDGFNTLNQLPERLNNRFCWSGSMWWEPWGAFGPGYSDLEDHDDAAIRLGGSYTYAVGRGSQTESDAVENSPVRLSDGTIVTTLGALAPGVTLQTYDISLAAIDLATKYRGLGISAEVYAQNLLNLGATGPIPVDSIRAYGGVLQGGYFVLPQRAELYARTSFVTGGYGSGSEAAAGFNWFFLKGRDNLRYTFDAAWLESSPAGQNRTGFVAGQTGLLLRTQITVVY
jgi:hypothetical protein